MTPPPIPAAAYYPDAAGEPQRPADVAVMTNTVLRPTLRRAIESVYAQSFAGRIQLMIGVDVERGDPAILDQVLAARPPHVSALVWRLPYSSARRHGGVHAPGDGGALRALSALAANAPHLAQLDDDNSWTPRHLELLKAACAGKAWAFSQRLLLDEVTDRPLGPDLWDSVGPGKGRLSVIGGFVDPNCLMIDKVELVRVLGCFADTPNTLPGQESDRLVFRAIHQRPHARVAEATVLYRIRRDNVMWRPLRQLRARGALSMFGWPAELEPAPPEPSSQSERV